MTLRLSGHFSIFGLVFFVLKYLLRKLRNNGVVKISNFHPKASETCYNLNISKAGYYKSTNAVVSRPYSHLCLIHQNRRLSLFWYTHIVM